MGKRITLSDIIKSRYGSDKDLPLWVNERREICAGCKFNSKNKPKEEWSTKEKAWVMANHGKDTCLSCRCMLSAKTKLAHAKCPLTPPKWNTVETVAETSNLKIENISTTPLTINEVKGEIWLDYGTIPIGEETDVRLLIHDTQDKMTDISVETSCGCTESKAEKIENQIVLSIVYDTNKTGSFTKTVVMTYKKNNIEFEKVFKIKGKTE